MTDPTRAPLQSSAQRQRHLIIGVGSPHGDDRCGWAVVDGLAQQQNPCRLLRKAAVPHDLLDWLEKDLPTHIVDACQDSCNSIRRFELCGSAQFGIRPVPASQTFTPSSLRSGSTHQLDLLAILELAMTLDRLPDLLVLWTIPAVRFVKNGSLQLQTQLLVDECIGMIRAECYGD